MQVFEAYTKQQQSGYRFLSGILIEAAQAKPVRHVSHLNSEHM